MQRQISQEKFEEFSRYVREKSTEEEGLLFSKEEFEKD